MAEITLTSGYGTGLTPKQKTAFQRPYSTGSLVMNDGDSVRDASGDDRITFTDGGTLVLKDEAGNAGITLDTDQTTTFANHITSSAGLLVTSTTQLNGNCVIGNASSDTIGFYGATPVAQSSAYTATTQNARNADTATTAGDLQDVVQTLIADLKATGILG